jgi:outer membrane biosynthesis protein TonB
MSIRSRISFLVGSFFVLSLLVAGKLTPTVVSAQAILSSPTATNNIAVNASKTTPRSFLPMVSNNSSVNKKRTPTPTATLVRPTATKPVATATPVQPTATRPAATATPIQPTATRLPPTATPIQPTATKPAPTATINPAPTINPSTPGYYVSTSGSDSNSGSSTSPWRTIQKAASSMKAGDTLYVQAGDYSDQRVNVTISGSQGAQITYKANGSVRMKGFNITASYITVDGFEIANTDYARGSRSSSGILLQGANNIIQNNYIHDATMRGIYFYLSNGDPTTNHDNIVKNNRLYHNEQVGMEVHGRNNLIEGNEIWGTVQCHPNLTKVENVASDNNGATCPNYPAISWLDADGIDFFGQGHIFRHNYIHDIPFGPTGINPSIGDYNGNPHIDCFQTWSDGGSHQTASSITFDGNRCDNAQVNGSGPETGSGFMLDGGANNIRIDNNIIRAYMGVYSGSTSNVNHLYIYNNIWQNDLSINVMWPKVMQLENTTYVFIKNNIFYDQPYMTVYVLGDTTGTQIDYNLAYNSNGTMPRCVQWSDFGTCQATPNHEMWGVNPQFVNPAAKDFHLNSTSPAINAGTQLPDVPYDYDRLARPQGGAYDIGAYER